MRVRGGVVQAGGLRTSRDGAGPEAGAQRGPTTHWSRPRQGQPVPEAHRSGRGGSPQALGSARRARVGRRGAGNVTVPPPLVLGTCPLLPAAGSGGACRSRVPQRGGLGWRAPLARRRARRGPSVPCGEGTPLGGMPCTTGVWRALHEGWRTASWRRTTAQTSPAARVARGGGPVGSVAVWPWRVTVPPAVPGARQPGAPETASAPSVHAVASGAGRRAAPRTVGGSQGRAGGGPPASADGARSRVARQVCPTCAGVGGSRSASVGYVYRVVGRGRRYRPNRRTPAPVCRWCAQGAAVAAPHHPARRVAGMRRRQGRACVRRWRAGRSPLGPVRTG